MVSQFVFAPCVISLTLATAASVQDGCETSEGQCRLQGENHMVQPLDVSLLQTHSHFATVKRDLEAQQQQVSLTNKDSLEAEAQMAFAEIRDELHAHPKVAKKALHEALIEMQQSSWPFTTGASTKLFSPASASNVPVPTKKTDGKMEQQPVVAVQQQQHYDHRQPDAQAATPAPQPGAQLNTDKEGGSEPAQPAESGAKIAPFGKEDTAKELTQHAQDTQDTLVDAVENAEVAEVKRSVFRALTRLRAASIKEFDTIARLETQAFDEYNDAHHFRAENPLEYIHSSEPKVKEDKFTSFH
jgi:hypothetical protein